MSPLRDLLRSPWFRPAAREPIPVAGTGAALARGQTFVVLSWNVQFGAGRNGFFFYDGGPDVQVAPSEVARNLAGIAALIVAERPDVVLLQEVDRRSRRTGRVDQHVRLRDAVGLPCSSSTPYFRVPYVPVPPRDPLGPVDMHLSVFSRFTLGPGTRTALAPLNEPRWRRAFNLRRALQHHPLAVQGLPALNLYQTHLSAFARGDGSLERQGLQVRDAVRALPGPALLVGDFNSLPPGDDPRRLGAASVLYSDASSPIAPLVRELDVLYPPVLPAPHEAFGTYVPWGSNWPDRTLDYAFGRELVVHEARALPDGAQWSDHLPVRLTLGIA